MPKWIAMFSQTGGELNQICSQLNIWPDVVITNAKEVNESLWTNTRLIRHQGKVTSDNYRQWFAEVPPDDEDNPVYITLHGWLRIIPADICKPYLIFNGHPGDIFNHPELKGRDPQKKAFELGLETSGCVIHRVEEGVDEGQIVSLEECSIKECKSIDDVIAKLKKISLKQWKIFLEGVL